MQRILSRMLGVCLILCIGMQTVSATALTPAEEAADPTAFAAEILTNVINTDDKTMQNDIRLINQSDRQHSAVVYNALYDASGRLIGGGRARADVAAGETATVTTSLRYTARSEGCVQKIFVWDTKMRPLMDPLVKENVLFETTPAKITLSQTEATLWMKGSESRELSLELTAAVEPSNAVIQRLEWSSSNPDVADVDAYGNVTAKARGEAIITARAVASGVSASCAVSVKLEPESIYFTDTEYHIVRYETDVQAIPQINIAPEDADWPTLLWESSNTDVAEFIDGTVYAHAAGTALISATAAHNPELRAECLVIVTQEAVSISLNRSSINMWDDGVYQLTASVQPADYHPEITYHSSDPSVAEVDASGRVTAHKKGTTTITASTDSVWTECLVTVYREDDYIGQASAKYESNGNPGTISSGNGDPGRKSYGAYQFASAFNVPYDFARWLVSSGENPGWGDRLTAAYAADGNSFGNQFDAVWTAIAGEDANGFLLAQHGYIKVQYYDVAVKKLSSNYGFQAEQYGIALKSAIWSRAVQHGASGAVTVIGRAFEAIGGFEGKSEEALIRAIYGESGMALSPSSDSQTVVTSESAKQYVDSNGNYLIYGKYLKYYSGSSSSVQYGVWKRLNINELNDLIHLISNPPVEITP